MMSAGALSPEPREAPLDSMVRSSVGSASGGGASEVSPSGSLVAAAAAPGPPLPLGHRDALGFRLEAARGRRARAAGLC